MTKRPTRSDKYQYLIQESSCSHEAMENFSNGQSLGARLNPFEYNERIDELIDELKAEFWKIAEVVLTPLQKSILKMRAEGITQMEIADRLDICQSSVVKCIKGNMDYTKVDEHGNPKVYGGAYKKLRKHVFKNERILEILNELNEIRSEKM